MRNPTDLMIQILKNEKAQEMIDYVSSIYGDAYVGLWLFEILGWAVNEAYRRCEGLMDETSPVSATWALDYYEDQYGLPRGIGMTLEQRRNRILSRTRNRGPFNPERICEEISNALDGVEVFMEENYDENTFLVNIRSAIEDMTKIEKILDDMKPAHLIYIIRVALLTAIESQMYTGVAIVHSRKHIVEVKQ